MPSRLKDKRAIITGASRGIGRAIAVGLFIEGARVVINYPSVEEEEEAQDVVAAIEGQGGIAYSVEADIRDQDQVHNLLDESVHHLGGIDILVNNAGVCPWHEFLEVPLSVWEETQGVNHRGTFLCSQAVARHMISDNIKGSIVTIGSIGAYSGSSLQAHYNASKAAVSSLMRSMAVALGVYGIRCNTILPGCVETRMNRDRLADEKERDRIMRRTPLGRIGVPQDIVGAAIFFASDESKFCTGSELCVDGGISIYG